MKKLLLILCLMSPSALASIGCAGTVKNVLQYANGTINVFTSYRGDYTVMCSVKDHWKGVSPESCKGMLSVLLTAQSTGKRIATYYSGNKYTCANLPTYGHTPGPVYVGIVND